MVASSRDGLFTEDFGVTALLELDISGWLWEDFALALSLEVFVHQVGMGSSLPLCLVPLDCKQHVSSASSWGLGCTLHRVGAGSPPLQHVAPCLHGNLQQEHPLVQSSWRGGGEDVAATFPEAMKGQH